MQTLQPTISRGARVTIRYTLSDEDGRVVDSSADSGPVVYVHGEDEVFPGLEAAIAGKVAGDRVSFTVPPDEGFGVHDPERIVTMPRARFDFDVTEGQIVMATMGPARPIPLQVVALAGDRVILDGNHPLAGRTVSFTVEVVEVTPPGARPPATSA